MQGLFADLILVDPQPDSADRAGRAQRVHGAIALVHGDGEVMPIGGAMRVLADVVHVQDIDAVQSEALQAVFEGAHDPRIAVVIFDIEGHGRAKTVALPGVAGGPQQATDLSGQYIRLGAVTSQQIPEPALAQPLSIVRSGIVVAKTGLPGGVQQGAGVTVGKFVIEIAKRRATKAQRVEGQGRVAELAPCAGFSSFSSFYWASLRPAGFHPADSHTASPGRPAGEPPPSLAAHSRPSG